MDGYEGDTCAVDTNECDDSPCMHSGVCSDSNGDASIAVGAFQCACLTGWTGATCSDGHLDTIAAFFGLDMATGDCAPLESAVAVVQDTWCAPGAESSNYCPSGCNADECDSAPCANGGQCFDGAGVYLCLCTEGFRGDNCADDEFVCESGNYFPTGTEDCNPCAAGTVDDDFDASTPCVACGCLLYTSPSPRDRG